VDKRLSPVSNVQVFPVLRVVKTEKGRQVPEDARLFVEFLNAPKDKFYGMQIQISINTVQGNDFPYLYCVLIAKNGTGFLNEYPRFIKPKPPASFSSFVSKFFGMGRMELVYEFNSDEEVDVLVIRREAEKDKRGYLTNFNAAKKIVSESLEMTQKIIEDFSSRQLQRHV